MEEKIPNSYFKPIDEMFHGSKSENDAVFWAGLAVLFVLAVII